MLTAMEIQTFVVAGVGVLFGLLARRHTELSAMDQITLGAFLRMVWLDLMLWPALAGASAAIILYFEFPWSLVLLLSIASGAGGPASLTLLVELLGTVFQTLAGRIGGGAK